MDEWEISTNDIIMEEHLGEGAFGEVYKGVIRGPLGNPKISAILRHSIGVPVAIKMLKSESCLFLDYCDVFRRVYSSAPSI